MSFVVIFLGIVAALFALAFLTKRRFGVLGLALAAGAMLSSMWAGDLTPLIINAGLVVVKPPLSSLVSAGLILLPAILLFWSGPTYKSMPKRVVGAAAFATLAGVLLLETLGTALVIDGAGKPIYDFFVQYRTVIITALLAFALFDILTTKTPRSHDHKEK